ncbi:MAG: cation transporter [Bacteroidales bacterium]|nr:cation transporter [Bacteroidales bacterium]
MKKTIFALLCAGVMTAGFSTVAVAQDNKPSKNETETVKFNVSMTCESCAEKISENVSYEKGVKDLNVCLADKTVEVTYDPSKTDARTLNEAIAKLGYEVDTVKTDKKMQIKETANKVADKTVETSNKVADKTVETSNKVADKTVETSNKVADKTAETAETVGEKTKDTANKVGEKTKDAANKVGDFFKKDKSE